MTLKIAMGSGFAYRDLQGLKDDPGISNAVLGHDKIPALQMPGKK
jgi:hypothetical protein